MGSDNKVKMHALLSPSASKRWLSCTPSLRLSELFGDTGTSDAAMEGTVAHALCAIMLTNLSQRKPLPNMVDESLDLLCKSDEFTAEEAKMYYCADMWDYCCDYATFVYSQYLEAIKVTPDAVLEIETSIDISMYGEGMRGTTDAAIVSDTGLEIFDFKYGKGVKVNAKQNTQMMIYALGNIAHYEMFYTFEDVVMHIYQPRMDNCSSYASTSTDLKKWGEKYLRPRAIAAMQGEGDYKCGDWCRFCPARTRCKKIANTIYDIYTKYQGTDIPTLTNAELTEVIRVSKEVTTWYSAVSNYVLQQMKEGEEFEGLKLVAGRSSRAYSDESKIAEILQSKGYAVDDIYKERTLKGITDMEKLLKKKVMNELIGDLIIKSEGAPTIADIDDKRPALSDAKSDFENLNI